MLPLLLPVSSLPCLLHQPATFAGRLAAPRLCFSLLSTNSLALVPGSDCITQSVRHKAQCPVCKSKVSRRDVCQDDKMDHVVAAFAALHAHRGELPSQMQQRSCGSICKRLEV